MSYLDNEIHRARIDKLLHIQAKANATLGINSTPSEVKNVLKVISKSDRLIRQIDKKFFPTHKDIAELFAFNAINYKTY